jgi:3-deoxy-7-phosphoheptulonate synthase
MHPTTSDLRIRAQKPLIAPAVLEDELQLSDAGAALIADSRRDVARVVTGTDDRLLVVVGPCSVHDPAAAFEYAQRLREVVPLYERELVLVMRVYFEKPRTVMGWKGLINDPFLDGSFQINIGLRLARRLMLDVVNLGLPVATEFLDTTLGQYYADLVSWGAIGARTVESQVHRELASGLSMPVGFKNGTDGSVQTAVDAMRSSRSGHSFLGIDQDGMTSIIKTAGNPDGHLVLRGGRDGVNYHPHQTADAAAKLKAAGVPSAIMIDCSHANSGKDPSRQAEVWQSILEQRAAGRTDIVGAMLESHLELGAQNLGADPSTLRYGLSITDGCLDWEATAALLRHR